MKNTTNYEETRKILEDKINRILNEKDTILLQTIRRQEQAV